MAEREGFEPSVPLLTAHTISSRAPSASSDISPVGAILVIALIGANTNPDWGDHKDRPYYKFNDSTKVAGEFQ